MRLHQSEQTGYRPDVVGDMPEGCAKARALNVELARHFLSSFAGEEGKALRGFEPDVETVFLSYQWPGNARQMQNVIRNVVVLHNGDRVSPSTIYRRRQAWEAEAK